MSTNPLTFTEAFPNPTYAEWKAEVETALKGAPFDKKMLSRTYEGIALQPIYTRADWSAAGDPSGYPGLMPFTRGSRAQGNRVGDWDVRQLYTHPDPVRSNDLILHELERGVSSLLVRLDEAARAGLDADAAEAGALAGRDGVMIYSVDDLELLLTGVLLHLAPVVLQPGAQFLPAAAMLMALWQRRGTPPEAALGGFGADPIGVLAATGRLPVPLEVALGQAAQLARYTSTKYPNVTSLAVDTRPFHNAGANEAQDLAAAMATAVAYLRAMTHAGLSIDAACRQILFSLPLGADQFLGIAKLRAARKMWSRIAEVCGASEHGRAMRLHAVTAERDMTRCDPWVNMLRTTVSCFAGAVGGADAITVLPFDSVVGLPNDLGRRIARNTSVVLAEESNLAKVLDPGGGAWYVERRTDELAQAAWAEFQEIEKAGGMAAVLHDGTFAARIAAAYAQRELALARRKDAITGVSEFPNIHEPQTRPEQPDLAQITDAALARLAQTRAHGGAAAAEAIGPLGEGDGLIDTIVSAAAKGATLGAIAAVAAGAPTSGTPFPRHRLAERFEELRAASEAYLQAHGRRPAIFLANLGPIAQHTARAGFAKNFFEVAGIEGLSNNGFAQAAACVDAFKESAARIAILCSADAIYEQLVPSVAPALKAAGCEYLFLAGHPGEKEGAYRSAGVDDFIFLGGDVLKTTRATLAMLGVIDQ